MAEGLFECYHWRLLNLPEKNMLRPLSFALILFLPTTASAASRIIHAGQVVGVSEDIVLSGDDVLEVQGTAEKPCRLDANGQQIRTRADWQGRIKIELLRVSRPGQCQEAGPRPDRHRRRRSDRHRALRVPRLRGRPPGQRGQLGHGLPPQHAARQLDGAGDEPAQRVAAGLPRHRAVAGPQALSGQPVAKSVVLFENTSDWLIGGDKDEDSNLLIGMRASLSIHRCADMLVRGNYVHTEIPSFRWSQVHTLAVGSPCPELVVEHNVLRHGQWVVRGLAGAVPLQPGPRRRRPQLHRRADGRHAHPPQHLRPLLHGGPEPELVDRRDLQGRRHPDLQQHLRRRRQGPGPAAGTSRPSRSAREAFLASLRNNVFFNHPTNFASGTATIRPGFAEKKTSPGPARLGYADYNLFYNPDAREKAELRPERQGQDRAHRRRLRAPRRAGGRREGRAGGPEVQGTAAANVSLSATTTSEPARSRSRRSSPATAKPTRPRRKPAHRCRRPGRRRRLVHRRGRNGQERAE